MKRLAVIPGDPLYKYYQKGEVKERYWNPKEIFDEVHIISLCPEDVEPEKVQAYAGKARLFIHAIGRPNPLTLAFYYSRVRRLIEKLDPVIIRAHGPWHSGSLGVHAGRKLGIPCIVSVHNEIDVMRKSERQFLLRMVEPLEYYTMRNASAVILVSNYLHSYAQSHGSRKTITNYNRVYCSRFELKDHSRENQPIKILSVMRLDKQKDPECLIRAVAPLEAQLLLIGQGELEERLKALVAELGIGEKVEFIPRVPNEDIHEYYQKVDIFAMATHYEGFCIPVLEAMAAGLPIVASETEPIPEILGNAGITVPLEPTDFTRELSRLMADAELRRSLGERARERAEELDGELMEEREAEIYEAFFEGAPARIERVLGDDFRFIH
jgi:glycosyltransferase involved in cell wall biosynthesis